MPSVIASRVDGAGGSSGSDFLASSATIVARRIRAIADLLAAVREVSMVRLVRDEGVQVKISQRDESMLWSAFFLAKLASPRRVNPEDNTFLSSVRPLCGFGWNGRIG